MSKLSQLHQLFIDRKEPLKLSDVKVDLDITTANASSILCYFMNHEYCVRKQVQNPARMGKRMVWEYTYIIYVKK